MGCVRGRRDSSGKRILLDAGASLNEVEFRREKPDAARVALWIATAVAGVAATANSYSMSTNH